MGRTMPYECEHGRILDWGDFGGEDSKGEECAECTAESDLYLAGVLRARGAVVITTVSGFSPEAVQAAKDAFHKKWSDPRVGGTEGVDGFDIALQAALAAAWAHDFGGS